MNEYECHVLWHNAIDLITGFRWFVGTRITDIR